jgi:hypothetical protein|tara:strand:+ start:115 stop:996 length:882 start_codon:yes stop_codon:yes gene_type:complete
MNKYTNFRSPEDFKILDKFKDLPISFFYDYLPNPFEFSRNPHNIILVHEPNEFFGIHDKILNNQQNFSAILTWNEEILNVCDNSVLFTCNYQQDSLEFYKTFENKEKTFEVSFLSGVKDISEGHKFRRSLISLKDQINIPKKWFEILDDFDLENNVRPGYKEYSKDISHLPSYLKANPQVYGKRICFEDSMFHVCVENVKHNNWYTEKIGEAFCTKTVPIYWGCPNIGDYYDSRGIITFNTSEELLDIINNLTYEKYYEMKPYIDYNYTIALQDTFSNKLEQFFTELTKENTL